jgi:curved DNA-binding protein CbpA
MSTAQASVFQKHRRAGDHGGDLAWVARVSGRALRCAPEHASKDIEGIFELDDGDRVLWRLLQLPRKFADLEKAALVSIDDLRAALRAFVAADVVEVVDADNAKALLPAEIKRVRAEVAGKSWRPSAGALVAKVYRPDIDGGAGSAEGGAIPVVEASEGSSTSAATKMPTSTTASAVRAPSVSGADLPRTSTGSPVTSPGFTAPRTSTGSQPAVAGANMPRTSTGSQPAVAGANMPRTSTGSQPAVAGANMPRTSTGSTTVSTTGSTTATPPEAPPLNAPRTTSGVVPAAPNAIGNRPLLPADKVAYTQLAQAFSSMGKLDHYAFLGVPTTAEDSTIRAAYVSLARDYHPDRIAGSVLADDAEVRGWIEALFKRLGEAQKTLLNAESRARYDREQRALASTSGPNAAAPGARPRRPLEARNAFVMAETFFKKRDFAQAELHYRQAVNFDPEEGLIAVGLAWCIFLNPDQPAEKRRDDARKRLEEAVKKFKSGDAAYKLGRVLRELGDEAGAVKRFEEALRLTPNHVDAQREVRIVEMRKQKADGDKPNDDKKGLLGKLFKR